MTDTADTDVLDEPGTALAIPETAGWQGYADLELPDGAFETEVADARRQGEVLRAVARYSPCRQVRFELGWRGTEWITAARTLEQMGDEATIELLSGLLPGMRVPQMVNAEDDQWKRVEAVSKNGYMHIMFERNGYAKQTWTNVQGQSSPVVVRR